MTRAHHPSPCPDANTDNATMRQHTRLRPRRALTLAIMLALRGVTEAMVRRT